MFVAGAALLVCALVELAFPDRSLYHYGWFNVVLVALMVVVLMRLRLRVAVALFAVASVLAGFTTVASGLLGPDTQLIVAAPGASVRVDELGGALVFPIVQAADASPQVQLARGSSASPIGARRFSGPFLLQQVPRAVVEVNAGDAKNAHLTITQPTGNTFLSPVLLMQTRQSIAGMDLPYDTFSIPAIHRVVKAVLFGPSEAARLPALAGATHAVLFDVENENERSLKNGIGVSRDGEPVEIAGIALRSRVFDYPGVRVVSVPDVRFVIAAVVLALVAVGLTIARRGV